MTKKKDTKDPKYNRKPGDTLEGWQVLIAVCLAMAALYVFLFKWIFA